MRLTWILILVLVVLGLIYYTSETTGIIKIVGKHSLNFVKNIYHDLKSSDDISNIKDDLEKKYKG